jgi:amidohydrolase
MGMNEIFNQVEREEEEIIQFRRDFHANPETGFDLERTSGKVANYLRSWGIEVETGIAKSGVVGIIIGAQEGKTVALRADMDALPITEENDIPYKSTVPGKMHACGHDGHTAMLLGAAKVLSQHKEDIHGNIKLLFQPAEEGPGVSDFSNIGSSPTCGAKPMIEEGALKDVGAIFGMHLTTNHPIGTVNFNDGPAMASTDVFEIRLTGKGGHAGLPHKAIDAIAMGTKVVTEIQYMVSRQMNPLEPVIVSVGVMNGGSASNVIAENCYISGTIRTYSQSVRKEIAERLKNIVKNVVAISGGDYSVNIVPGLPPLINDKKMLEFAIKSSEKVVGKEKVCMLDNPSMGGEDFAYYLQEIPGAFMLLGAGNEEKGLVNSAHHPKFNFDEDALIVGTKLFIQLALDYLNN